MSRERCSEESLDGFLYYLVPRLKVEGCVQGLSFAPSMLLMIQNIQWVANIIELDSWFCFHSVLLTEVR